VVNEINVESTDGFPDAGVLLIGREAIEYTRKDTTTFIYEPYPEFDPEAQAGDGGNGNGGTGNSQSPGSSGFFQDGGEGDGDGEEGEEEAGTGYSQDVTVGRGKRDSLALAHPQGSVVTIFGFATDLDSELPAGGSTLISEIGEDTQTRVRLPWEDTGSGNPGGPTGPGGSGNQEGPGETEQFQNPPFALPPLLLADADEIPAKTTEGFPENGFLLLVRFYRSQGTGGQTPGGGMQPGGGGGQTPGGGGCGGDGCQDPGGGQAAEINIQYEMVYYQEKDDGTFKNVKRGLFDTQPEEFPMAWIYILLISVPVSDPSDYEKEGRIQIDNEWFVYDEIVEEEGTHYFVRSKNDVIEAIFDQGKENADETTEEPEDPNDPNSEENSDNPPDFKFDFRARSRTLRGLHESGQEIVPVFKTKDKCCGRFDVVTLITQQGKAITHRDTAMVNWADLEYVAFTECLNDPFTKKNSRLLKFPSGETAGQLDGSVTVGQSAAGEATVGILDEAKFGNAMRSVFRLSDKIEADDTELKLEAESTTVVVVVGKSGGQNKPVNISVASGLRDCGVLKIGNELIGYAERDGETVGTLTRGFLGTEPAVHDNGAYVMDMGFITASALTAGISSEDNRIPLKSVSLFPREGYVLLGEEMIGYSRKDYKDQTLVVPSENPDSRGLFRGAFGSRPGSHGGGDVAILMPYRYFDGFREEVDVPEMAYFQTSFAARGAYWDRLTWEQDVPFEMYQAIKVYVRIDGKPSWNEVPTNKAGGIYLFDNPTAENILGAQGDSIEVRVYFQYKDDAFLTDAWKSTPVLKNFMVRYAQPLRVLHHEELTR
ncbi:MAG: hypothetical protein ACYTHN_08015, partial [Planctomycetota bacterium]